MRTAVLGNPEKGAGKPVIRLCEIVQIIYKYYYTDQ